MAVAIKMDELLVNWLGDDSMYENVMNLIEENKLAAQKQQQQKEQQQKMLLQDGSEEDGANASNTDGVNKNVDGTSTKEEEEAASKDQSVINNKEENLKTDDTNSNSSNASPRGVIPKFYLGDPSRPRRRRRLLPMPQSDSWEPLPANEQESVEGMAIITKDAMALNSEHTNNQDLPSEQRSISPPSTQAPLCVRDQVQAVYRDVGIPPVTTEGTPAIDPAVDISHHSITVQEFVRITKDIFRFPTFFNSPLCQRILVMSKQEQQESSDDATAQMLLEEPALDELITYEMVERYWLKEMEPYDAQERFFRLVKQPHAEVLVRDDFLPFIKALLNDHPGLEFLSNHAEFQEKYAVTVITRIFYCVNKCHSGRITCREIRRSDLLDAFLQVDEEEDINKVTRYFSYEHFYVLYCRFWELDHDRDYRITREDLLKYGDQSLSHMIVDRIFDAAPRPFEQPSSVPVVDPNNPDGEDGAAAVSPAAINREFLSYEDFIYFMLSEEDKANDVSVRYWFTCVDVDGDGRLNNMEMRSFYAVQLHRMQCLGHEIVPFEDMLCQMMDMIKPANTDCIVVEDFLQLECAPVAGALFDALFNLNKYLLFEQRDPFVERQKREDEFDTDWDRFACIDYNRLAMEEEAREEEAMEIDWVTVDDDDEDGLMGSNAAAAGEHGMQMQVQQPDEYNMSGVGAGDYGGAASSEAPF